MYRIVTDIGNTRTKIGLFKDNILIHKEIWLQWTAHDLALFQRRHHAQEVIFCSVAYTPPDLRTAFEPHVSLLELTHDTPLPFINHYRTPLTLGKDRLAAVAGAQALYDGTAVVVIDCGTCVKYEALTAAGVYLGGNIAPGAFMRIKAMHHFTQRLPEVPLQLPDEPIGYSTETALQNGALLGMALEMAGFVRIFRQNMQAPSDAPPPDKSVSPLQVILTGGDAALFTEILPDLLREEPVCVFHHEPDLTLYGLHHILRFSDASPTGS